MNKNDMTKELKERLHWYIYDSSYYDYNQQEVDYILDYLKKHDSENEVKIEESGVIITPFSHTAIEIRKSKSKTFRTISSVIIAATLIISILPIHDTIASLALLKRGNFTFIQKDENSATILMPSSELVQRYKTYEQLEDSFRNKIWKPDEIFDWKLQHIKIRGENIIYQYFRDVNSDNTITLIYGDSYNIENYDVTEKTNYKNIFIDFAMNDEIYYAFFSVLNTNYSVETTDKSVIEDVTFQFIDFLYK